jgi:hypothetical protein
MVARNVRDMSSAPGGSNRRAEAWFAGFGESLVFDYFADSYVSPMTFIC